MATSEQIRSRPKSTHKQNDLSQKERLAYFDEDEVTLVRLVLTEDPDFQAKARLIAKSPAVEHLAAAEREAETYAPYETPKRRVIAELLFLTAQEPWHSRGSTASLFFANLGRKAVWANDPNLDDLTGRRVRERWDALRDGAQALAWFGAGRCIGCGSHLGARQYRRGAWCRRTRRRHCEACLDRDPRESLCIRRETDMRKAFDVLTGARQRHRASRRAST